MTRREFFRWTLKRKMFKAQDVVHEFHGRLPDVCRRLKLYLLEGKLRVAAEQERSESGQVASGRAYALTDSGRAYAQWCKEHV